jgi:CBS domain-containing protein
MKVNKVMHKKLVTVPTSATIHDAALKMKNEEVGSVLIVDETGKLEGIVTDRDIAIAVGANTLDPKQTCAYDIMTDEPITVSSDADIESALRLMNTGNVRRLPVCKNGKLVGMLSSADVASEIKEEIDHFMGLEGDLSKH